MKITLIKKFPDDIKKKIFSYTTEYARIYSKLKNFKKFSNPNNEIFPSNFYNITKNMSPLYADKLWKLEYKLQNIVREKSEFIKNRKNRPCMQHSRNSFSEDFKENVFPEIHNLKYDLWNIDNFNKLISYTLKITLCGYYTFLFVKPHYMEMIKQCFYNRAKFHKMKKYTKQYIVFYDKDFKNFENKIKCSTIPRIICVPFQDNKILEVKIFIEMMYNKNIKNYVIYPRSFSVDKNLLNNFSGYSNGSGKYDITNRSISY